LQGEGIRQGAPSIFIRLANCNLTCNFCDTEFTSGTEYDINDMVEVIEKYKCKDIVWTGGEPLMQLNEDILNFFRSKKFFNCVETNGSQKLIEGFDFVTVSPKVAEHILKKNFKKKVDELKYVRKVNQSIPKPLIEAEYYFISPMFEGNSLDKKNLLHCIKLCKDNPKWRLTIQQHKLLNIL
jgi:organic radical activating enzyme